MAFGFASITATDVAANESSMLQEKGSCAEKNRDRGAYYEEYGTYDCNVYGEINDVAPPQQFAYGDDDRHECGALKQNQDGVKLCVVTDENGNERVAGIEVPDGVEVAYTTTMPGCVWNQEKHKYDCPMTSPWLPKADEAEGEQIARGQRGPSTKTVRTCDSVSGCGKTDETQGEQFAGCVTRPDGSIVCPGDAWKSEDSEPIKTASGTFYPLPMMTVAEMDKLLAPGGTSVASFDKILAPGGTAVEGDYQFADREDGSGGDFGGSGGGDFGEGDRAAASTAAE